MVSYIKLDLQMNNSVDLFQRGSVYSTAKDGAYLWNCCVLWRHATKMTMTMMTINRH